LVRLLFFKSFAAVGHRNGQPSWQRSNAHQKGRQSANLTRITHMDSKSQPPLFVNYLSSEETFFLRTLGLHRNATNLRKLWINIATRVASLRRYFSASQLRATALARTPRSYIGNCL